MTDITVLKHLTALRLEVTIWSARRKLTAADLCAPNLPPETVASLGSKKVCNPEDLRVFGALKSRAVALLDRHGVRFLGGWALPEGVIDPVNAGLDAIGAEFEQAKEGFLARYDEAVKGWIRDNPAWEALLTNATVSADVVRSRLGFAWQMFRLQPPKGNEASKPLTEAVQGLGGTLFGEVAKVAEEAWQKSFLGKTEVSLKAAWPLKGLRQKLAGLSCLEPRVTPLVDLIDTGLAALPEKGPLTGGSLLGLQGLICLLRDPEAMRDHGQKILDGMGLEAALQALVALPPAPVTDLLLPDETPDIPDSLDAVGQSLDSLGLW